MLAGKNILIIGSSRWIWRATAKLIREYHWNPIIHGKDKSENLIWLSEELACEYIFWDVTNKNLLQESIGQLSEKLPIHGLIYCTGIVEPKPFLETTTEDWHKCFDINVLWAVYACQSIIPIMQKQWFGKIALVSSIRGTSTMASARGTAYSVTKAAIINLTTSLAKECAPHINVNSVAPGFTETEMSQTWNEAVWNQAKSSLKWRPAKPQEIGEVLAFLMSDRSGFINGQTILVDGWYEISWK